MGFFVAIELGFSDVESVLARLNRVAEAKRVAFRARLKHFQRLGFPEGVNTGTGKRAIYGVRQLFQLVLAMELTQTGMAPQRVVRTINGNWSNIELQILAALAVPSVYELFHPPLTNADRVLILSPEALRDLADSGDGEYDYHDSVDSTDMAGLSDRLTSEDFSISIGEYYRHIVIQLNPLMMNAVSKVIELRPDLDWKTIFQEVMDLIIERAERLKEAIATIDVGVGNVDS
jgi:hypothetical protein